MSYLHNKNSYNVEIWLLYWNCHLNIFEESRLALWLLALPGHHLPCCWPYHWLSAWLGNTIANALELPLSCVKPIYKISCLAQFIARITGLILGLPSQSETVLLCNDVSHWLGANLESALNYISHFVVFCQQFIFPWYSWLLPWQWENHAIVPSRKSHNASGKYPAMHHVVTEMCMCAHFCYNMLHCGVPISVTRWCIVGYGALALWDLWDWSIATMPAKQL